MILTRMDYTYYSNIKLTFHDLVFGQYWENHCDDIRFIFLSCDSIACLVPLTKSVG